jgi:hypothetical protein
MVSNTIINITVLLTMLVADIDIILSYLILSYPILSYPILTYLIISYLILSFLILSYPILSNLSLSLGITQWEAPLFDSQPVGQRSAFESIDTSKNYERDQTSSISSLGHEREQVDNIIGIESDPWDAVDVDSDDDNEYTANGPTASTALGTDNRREEEPYGTDDNSDDDWQDDRYRQLSDEKIASKKISTVTKTISKFKTKLSSMKSMLKAKKSKLQGSIYRDSRDSGDSRDFYGDSRQQQPHSNQGQDLEFYAKSHKDKYDLNRPEGFDSQSKTSKQQFSSSSSSSSQSHYSQSQQSQSKEIVHDNGQENSNIFDDRSGSSRLGQYSNIDPNLGILQQQQDLTGQQAIDQNIHQDRYQEKNQRSSEKRKENELSFLKRDKDLVHKKQSDEEKKVKKISVRSMGEIDGSLWDDFDDSGIKDLSTNISSPSKLNLSGYGWG